MGKIKSDPRGEIIGPDLTGKYHIDLEDKEASDRITDHKRNLASSSRSLLQVATDILTLGVVKDLSGIGLGP